MSLVTAMYCDFYGCINQRLKSKVKLVCFSFFDIHLKVKLVCFSFFDIRIRAEYRILTFEILF